MGRSVEDQAFDNIRKSWGRAGYGHPFEDDVIRTLMSSGFAKFIRPATGTKTDKYEGTDFTFNLNDRGEKKKVRVDLTTAFSTKKDNMPLRYESKIALPDKSNRNIKVGVRIGNRYKGFTPFQEPVIVLGLDVAPDEYRIARQAILGGINIHSRDIMNLASRAYLDFTRDPDDRGGVRHILHYDTSYKIKPSTPDPVRKCLQAARDLDKNPKRQSPTPGGNKFY